MRKRSSGQVRSGAAVRILAAEDLFELGRFIETSGNQFSPESPILSSHCPAPWYCRELLASIFLRASAMVVVEASRWGALVALFWPALASDRLTTRCGLTMWSWLFQALD